MERLNTAELMDIAGIFCLIAMLAYVAVLLLRFIRKYIEVTEQHYAVYVQPDYYCPYARKRIAKRVVHDCKFAVFPINPAGRAELAGK